MIALPLLAAAVVQLTPVSAANRPVVINTEMQASVTIISVEAIELRPNSSRAKQIDRQYRSREELRLVEFY
jgi:hypothetical protein